MSSFSVGFPSGRYAVSDPSTHLENSQLFIKKPEGTVALPQPIVFVQFVLRAQLRKSGPQLVALPVLDVELRSQPFLFTFVVDRHERSALLDAADLCGGPCFSGDDGNRVALVPLVVLNPVSIA